MHRSRSSSADASASTTIGVLPRPEEVEAFLNDPAPDRRARLIDSLLLRPEFYDFWTLKFADILRANGRLIQSKGTYVFTRLDPKTNLDARTPIDLHRVLSANC